VGRRSETELWLACAHTANDSNGEIADEDLVGRGNRRGFADLAAVHVGSVGAAQIFHQELAILEHQATVVLGHVALGKDDVVVPDPSYSNLSLVESEILGLSTFLGQRQDEHGITLSKNASLVHLGRLGIWRLPRRAGLWWNGGQPVAAAIINYSIGGRDHADLKSRCFGWNADRGT
jgi:hypothetical protein